MAQHGIFFDRVAEGITQGQTNRLNRNSDKRLEQQQQFNQQQSLLQRADQAVGNTMKLAGQVIQAAKERGLPPQQIEAKVQPFFQEITEIDTGLGRDPSTKIAQLRSAIQIPFVSQADQAKENFRKEALAKVELFKQMTSDGIPREQAALAAFGRDGLKMLDAAGSSGQGQGVAPSDFGVVPLDQRGRLPSEIEAGRQTSGLDFEAENAGQEDTSEEALQQKDLVRDLALKEGDLVKLPELNIAVPAGLSPEDFIAATMGRLPENPDKRSKRENIVLSALDKEVRGKQNLINEFNLIEPLVRAAKTGAITEKFISSKLGGAILQLTGVDLTGQQSLLEALLTQQSSLALRLRNPESGFGLTGNTSERDLEFLRDAVPGLGKTPEGNLAALIIMRAKVRQDMRNSQLSLATAATGDLAGAPSKVRDAFGKAQPLLTDDERRIIQDLVNSAKSRGAYKTNGKDMSDSEWEKVPEFRDYKEINKGVGFGGSGAITPQQKPKVIRITPSGA